MTYKKAFFGLFLISGFATLLSLGIWQTQRLEWKTDIIKKLEAEYAVNPKRRILNFEELTLLPNEFSFRYGSVKGRFNYTKEILAGPKPLDGKIGYQVITPLALDDGGTILVNRGWIDKEQTNSIQNTQPKGTVSITGIFRKPDWNRFTPNNSPENNIWTKLDIQQISKVKKIDKLAPLMLYAESTSKEFHGLVMQKEKWLPRNKHKQYAIFWFSMAAAFLGIFGFLIWQNRSQKKPN